MDTGNIEDVLEPPALKPAPLTHWDWYGLAFAIAVVLSAVLKTINSI